VYNPQTKQVTVVDAQVLSLRTEVKALANVSAPEKVDQTVRPWFSVVAVC